MRWVRRSLPPGARHVEGVRLVRTLARHADVVYTTGMFGRSSLGSLLARTPFVVKLTADPAYERARRWRLWRGSLEDFQHAAPLSTLPLRLARDVDARARGPCRHAVVVPARARTRLGRSPRACNGAAEPRAPVAGAPPA